MEDMSKSKTRGKTNGLAGVTKVNRRKSRKKSCRAENKLSMPSRDVPSKAGERDGTQNDARKFGSREARRNARKRTVTSSSERMRVIPYFWGERARGSLKLQESARHLRRKKGGEGGSWREEGEARLSPQVKLNVVIPGRLTETEPRRKEEPKEARRGKEVLSEGEEKKTDARKERCLETPWRNQGPPF